MAELNATSPVHNAALSEGMTRANNNRFNFSLQDYLYGRKPDYWVYIYNVSEHPQDVFRPPLFANFHIPGRKRGEDYCLAGRLPSPLLAPQGNVDSGEVSTQLMDTRRVVMDMCNPDNLSLDQNAVIDTRSVTNIGNNLSKKGVFWSLNCPPDKKELDDAIKRMEAYYNFLLEKARATETSNPTELLNMLTPEHHAAADYYGVETSWHGKRSRPMDCPNCGERIKAGVAFHKTEEGTLCILDWKRAVASGVRTRAQAVDAGALGFAAEENVVVPQKASPSVSSIPTEEEDLG